MPARQSVGFLRDDTPYLKIGLGPPLVSVQGLTPRARRARRSRASVRAGPRKTVGGTSTGGSVVLQLAVDRPDLVRRLVVISAAYRLGPLGRELQAEMARLIRAGEPREAWHL